MKITDKNYNDIVDGVYNVDAGKVKRPWRDDKIFKSNGQTFRVLKTQDNTSTRKIKSLLGLVKSLPVQPLIMLLLNKK